MTSPATLIALAEKVEAAVAADRELDLAILKVLGGCHWNARLIDDTARSSGPPGISIPAYTASLDAALSLVPEGAFGGTLDWGPNGATVRIFFGGNPETQEGNAPTRALALTAASLRALAQTGEPNAD